MFQVLKKLMQEEFFRFSRLSFFRGVCAVSHCHGNERCLLVNKVLCIVRNGSELEGKHSICFLEGLGPSEYSLCVLQSTKPLDLFSQGVHV